MDSLYRLGHLKPTRQKRKLQNFFIIQHFFGIFAVIFAGKINPITQMGNYYHVFSLGPGTIA
jgi:hypothetical protein